MRAEGADLDFSVAVVDDDRIREVNRTWLDHDRATDVIAFDLRGEGPGPDAEIVVSMVTARREAASRAHDERTELLLYCVHGTLHILGYDDHDPEEKVRMFARQGEILAALGYEVSE